MAKTTFATPEPIAVVGSGCRFPGGANSPSSLWALLQSPRDLCQEIAPDRFSTTGFYHHDGTRLGTSNVRHSYLLQEDVRVFDAPFFNISPNEADAIDPQQRILLETVYEALEAGGHTLEKLRGSNTSVYVGTMTVDYHDTLVRDHNTIPKYFATGINRAIISNRVSYFFDWHGPSMTIDTACSSSLIAVHQGVQSLRNGESQIAVACGTQVLLGYDMYIGESNLKMLSPNGRSRMWDADADGYARGEGVAAIVMKRLSDAIADGDNIECIIRETGANQDGFSNGITVPSSEAQAALIRRTYANAGLDPANNPYDRPQYFEAHGTGTQAGDPKEAAAIFDLFGQQDDTSENTPLYVGSIKTIIGHLEGAAGLAGLLKASNSLQHGIIPPNLSFARLNPKIEPFYKGLEVPTSPKSWPALPNGTPRRASVNSFGFGGANAHAILEQYIPNTSTRSENRNLHNFLPFVFSALTETSLVAILERYSRVLKSLSHDIDASDLAWTLHSRRSQLSTKVAFSAPTVAELVEKIDNMLTTVQENKGQAIGTRSRSKTSEATILGVFTGQGAQWPAMGAQLIRHSNLVRLKIQKLEDSLAALPPADRPQWSLREEMLAGADTSRISEAALSQPLCTAVQIVLVDLLQSAGITFTAVVGHSSGEIAAAYAAGFLSATDAIRVAYYRGLYARLAGNKENGQKGAMLAMGASWDDAQNFVSSPQFKGRLAIAAHNSSASVTLSGDADSIAEAKSLLDEQRTFARLLKVDTAYHSHHMLACGNAYVTALRACGVSVRQPNTRCNWFSSVTPGAKPMEATDDLQDIYWRDNMTNTVLFADALKHATSSCEHFDLALEVGPHPALKGPATQSIADVRSVPLPYSGVLSRGRNDIEVFSEALGFVWTLFGSKAVNLQSFGKAVNGESHSPKLVVGLPSYQWDHERVYWAESRRSKKIRERKQPPHELLGFLSPESSGHDMRWTNVLKVSDIPWMDGHQLQGLTVFPAAGYVAMAIEACRQLAGDKNVELYELHSLSIPRAITFEEGDSSGAETLVTLTGIEHNSNQTIVAGLSIYSASNVSTGSEHDVELVASGEVKILLGEPHPSALPCDAVMDQYNTTEVDSDRVYSMFSELGYGYTGPFRGLTSTRRKLNQASAMVNTYAYSDDESTFYLVHPSMLDVAIQSSMLAYSSPGDERLWSLHVPTKIGTIRVNPDICNSLPTSGSKIPISTVLDPESHEFSASIGIYGEDGQKCMVQVEDLVLKPFAPATEAEDRWMYSSTKLGPAVPNAGIVMESLPIRPSSYERQVAVACERLSYYYLRQWKAEITAGDWAKCEQPHFTQLRAFIDHTITRASMGNHPTLKKSWDEDSAQNAATLISTYSNDATIQLISTVGENMPSAVRGDTDIMQHMVANGLFGEYHRSGLGLNRYQSILTGIVKQLTYRYPHARILDIGASTGGVMCSAVDGCLNHGGAIASYTCTVASEDVKMAVTQGLKASKSGVVFKVLDIGKEPATQGFELHSYDIIIASNTLCATAPAQRALEHVKQLLRPGGYLVVLEPTDNDQIRLATMMGGLPASWMRAQSGSPNTPFLSLIEWHSVMRKTGFSGIDSMSPKTNDVASVWPFSVMVSQAVNEQVQFLRRPISSPSAPVFIESLVILGTGSLDSSRIAEEVGDTLARFCGTMTVLDDLPTEEEALALDQGSTFINLVDLDSPIFKTMTNVKMEGLKRIFELARHVLWLTRGAQLGTEPYHAASLAFCRSIAHEATHISVGALDIFDVDDGVSKIVAEQLLRQCALAESDNQEILWSNEPEIFLRGGKLLLPRIMPNLEQNARLNATRRVISKTVSAARRDISIVSDTAGLPRSLVQDVSSQCTEIGKGEVEIESSSLSAICVAPESFLYLGIGKSKEVASTVVTLSATNSRTTAPLVFVTADYVKNADCMTVAIASELLASSTVGTLASGDRLLVHCSMQDRCFAAALSKHAIAKSIHVEFLCTDSPNVPPSWIVVGHREARHAVRRKLLAIRPTHFLDLTKNVAAGITSPSSVDTSIISSLPKSCKRIEATELVQCQSSVSRLFDKDSVVNKLQHAVAAATSPIPEAENCLDAVFNLDQISSTTLTPATGVVHWITFGEVAVQIQPTNGNQLFSKDKTYILFGLSGQVGQSLCEWMVSSGAGCVCLTSRRPKVDQQWLEAFSNTETIVKVMAVDITDMESLNATVNSIRETCPPIGGIVNGANVLSDAPFSSMSADMMLQALGPKIDGSFILDRAFYNDELDFFVMFSSISCVIGTAGQSNYVAANGFMNGLARQRRRRGLAASALDIGLILGIGLAESAGQHVVDSLQKYGITPLSEPDLRLAFAESIRAGYASPTDAETGAIPAAVMTSGLRTITSEETDIVWYDNPIFSHLVIEAKNADDAGQSKNKTAALPLKEQIANALSKADAMQALKDSFATKLAALLQSVGQKFAYDSPLVELGIDSLVAVEVRSWFLKTLKVDVPVLKLIGGSSLDEVCEVVMKKLPEELVAQIGQGSGTADTVFLKERQVQTQPAPEPQSENTASHSSSSSEKSSSGIQTPAPAETPASTVTQLSTPLNIKDETEFEPFRDRPTPQATVGAIVRSEPMSIGQSRFWFLRLLVEDPTTFNVALSFRMAGRVRVGDLERAVRTVGARHESLRTCFIVDEQEADQAAQKVLSRSLVKLERKSVNSVDEVATLYAELRDHEFDLAHGPLLRLILLKLSATSHYLLVNYHHIIMDMASFQVLTSEIEKVYNGKPLGPPPRQYPDFSMAQRQAIVNGELDNELNFWKGIFPVGEQPPVLSLLPMARSNSRVNMTNYAVHQVGSRLDPAISARVKAASKAQRSTPFHFYLAAFKSLLFSFVDDQDLTIGIADANRQHSNVMGSIGFFLNLLPLKFRRLAQQTFADAIVEARNTAYAALENSRLPFDVLLKELNVARSSSYSPFFQAFFDYRQQTSDRQSWLNCQFDLDQMHPGRTAYDISLDVADLGSEVHITLRAQKCIYDLTAANLLLETYTHFINTLSQDLTLTLQETPLFSEKQLTRAVQIGVGPDMTSGWPATLPHRIDQMALQYSESIALMDGLGSKLTYTAMIKRVEAIAESLINANIANGSRVLVYQQATTDWVCSLLAIMRIGGVYVPLDLRNPISRLAAQASHCQPAAVLADDTTVVDASQLYAPAIINVSIIAPLPTIPVANSADPDAPAAILYTSGSTGTPKGIMIKHSGIRNEMEGYTKTYSLGAERVLQQSAFTFDFAMDQIFTGLVNGGMVYIVPWSKRGDPISITEIIAEQSITYTKVTPSEYSMWIQYGGDNLRQATKWRFAFGGGEPLTNTILRQFTSLDLPNLCLHNSYGPAEISIASHKGFIDYREQSLSNASQEDRRVPCGYSLPNYATYIMDGKMSPLPAGMPGEVIIGGPGVSLGYLANDELTARVFLPNPHATPRQIANGWTSMHRTGDVGHLEEDGTLIFRNRIAGDTQVKIRGLRIDLRDIESNMISTAGGVLKEAIVTLRDGDPDYLVAHVIFAAQNNVTDESAFLESLLSRLSIPQYMIPVVAVALEKLPLSSHSKVDRKAIKNLPLPRPAKVVDEVNSDDAELTETMARLRQLWQEALPNIEKLGLAMTPSTNFFMIGGNSLLIVRLQSKIRKVFNVAVRLVDLLNANTLGEMARKIEECPSIDLIDWEAETALPSVPAFLNGISPKTTKTAKTVLITGATGNLSKHVLPVLTADQHIGKIHCVVRDKRRQGEPFTDPKIVHHVGDLSLPLIGLGVDEFRDLAEHVDVILHMGAVRAFWDNYHMLCATNVQPTKELVKLAAARKIPIHFISTSGVLPQDVLELGLAPSAAAYEPSSDGSNGYVASKWASERLLERSAASPLAVPSYVYRFLPSRGQAQGSKQDILDEFVRCTDLTGAMLDTAGWEGRMDLIPGRAVAQWLCESVIASMSPTPTTVTAATHFLNYESPITIQVEELQKFVEEKRGNQRLSRMPILKWMGRIKAVGFSYILASQDATIKNDKGDAKLSSRR